MNMLTSIYFNFFAQQHTVRGAREGEGVCTCFLSTAPPGLPKRECPERASPPTKQCPQRTHPTASHAESSDVNTFYTHQGADSTQHGECECHKPTASAANNVIILSREHDAMSMKTCAGVQHTCPSTTAAACCTQPQMGHTHQDTHSCCYDVFLSNIPPLPTILRGGCGVYMTTLRDERVPHISSTHPDPMVRTCVRWSENLYLLTDYQGTV